ncbi:MAG: insulinase family protein [Spirochaetales bacterium]|nr:insulinase family protein [Spirochaetales bacterium]
MTRLFSIPGRWCRASLWMVRVCASACAIAVSAVSCATVPAPVTAPEPEPAPEEPWRVPEKPVSTWRLPSEPGPYAAVNAPTIHTRTLANGATLIVKSTPDSRVFSIKAAFHGSSAMTPPDRFYLEALTLALMARGSRSYPLDDILRLQRETTGTIGYTDSGCGWASLNLDGVTAYREELISVFADCLANPAFDPVQFEVVRDEWSSRLKSLRADRREVAIAASRRYGAATGSAEASLDDVLDYYSSAMTTERLVIVAVGNLDVETTAELFNSKLASMPRGTGLAASTDEPLQASALLLEDSREPGNLAYVLGTIPTATASSPDIPALRLAVSILQELLSGIVKAECGAGCSARCEVHACDKSSISFELRDIDRPSEARQLVDKAIGMLASGVSPTIKGGDSEYAPLEETLAGYKSRHINAFYADRYGSAEIASLMVDSFARYGDGAAYLRYVDSIRAVQPADIMAVVKAYLVGPSVSWVIVSGTELLPMVDTAAFEGALGASLDGD